MVKKKKRKTKKRKPKGKPLSAVLKEKEAARAASDEGDDAASEQDDEESLEDDLRSEPPPAFASEDDEDGPLDHEDGDEDLQRDEPSDAGYAADEEEEEKAEDEPPEPRSSEPDDDDDDRSPSSVERDSEDDDEEYDDDELAAAQMGHQRYVIAGFFALWMVVGYICGQILMMAWSKFAAKDWFVEKVPSLAAVPHEGELISRASITLVLGAVVGAGIVLRYYLKPEVRTWADEVAEQLTKVKWPTKKEVGNNTVVCIVASAVITLYLTLLDRFWGFLTNIIYTSGGA